MKTPTSIDAPSSSRSIQQRYRNIPQAIKRFGEGLKFARLLMALSTLAPLFVLMAIKGNSFFPEKYLLIACFLLVTIPIFSLRWRIHVAETQNDVRALSVGHAKNHSSQVLVYLFSILLPFYVEDIGSYRDLVAMVVALSIIVFLFYRLNLHYLNIWFVISRYNVFTVQSPEDGNPYTGREDFIIITKKKTLLSGERVNVLRISNGIYMEKSQ